MAAGFPMLRLALLVAIPYTFAPRAVFQNKSTRYGNSNDGSFSLAAVGAAAWSGVSEGLLHFENEG